MAEVIDKTPVPVSSDPTQDKVLLSWKSLEKPYKVRSKDFYSTVLVLAVLVAVVLFFIEGIMPVLVIAAVVFVLFVSTRTPPKMTDHSITTQAIVTGGQRFSWDELVVFWVDKTNGDDLIHVATTKNWPTQLLMIGPKEGETVTTKEIREVIARHLPYQQPATTLADRASRWLSEKLPLE